MQRFIGWMMWEESANTLTMFLKLYRCSGKSYYQRCGFSKAAAWRLGRLKRAAPVMIVSDSGFTKVSL